MITVNLFETQVYDVASRFSFVERVVTLDKTANTIKLRLHITTECFVQIYTNVQKELVNYVLILDRSRIYGRNCDGGTWHRHPYEDPDAHDFGPEGAKEISLEEFLIEVQQILQREGIL
jgi:hypothetical protein